MSAKSRCLLLIQSQRSVVGRPRVACFNNFRMYRGCLHHSCDPPSAGDKLGLHALMAQVLVWGSGFGALGRRLHGRLHHPADCSADQQDQPRPESPMCASSSLCIVSSLACCSCISSLAAGRPAQSGLQLDMHVRARVLIDKACNMGMCIRHSAALFRR